MNSTQGWSAGDATIDGEWVVYCTKAGVAAHATSGSHPIVTIPPKFQKLHLFGPQCAMFFTLSRLCIA